MKEKILRGLAHLAPDLASNMQSAPSPAADLKSRDKTGTVLSDLSGPHPVCEGSRHTQGQPGSRDPVRSVI